MAVTISDHISEILIDQHQGEKKFRDRTALVPVGMRADDPSEAVGAI